MKILTVLTYYRPHTSGLTIYAERLAVALAQRGHQVTVMTTQYDKRLPPEEMMSGVRVVRIPVAIRISKGVLAPTFGLVATRLVAEHDAVVLHLPQFDAPGVALRARLMGKPVLLTYHCDLHLPHGIINRLVNFVVKIQNNLAAMLSNRIITYTQDYADHSTYLSRYRKKLTTFLPPVVLPQAEPGSIENFARTHQIRKKKPTIGMVTRFAAEKGIEVLLDAMPTLLQEHPNMQVLFAGQYLNVIGEKAYADRLMPRIEAHQREGCWTFLGNLTQEQLAALYPNLDVLVVPSINSTEAFGLVQVEAMMNNVPCVVSALPGVRYPVVRHSMGIVVPIGDPLELASAVGQILRSKKKYRCNTKNLAAEYSPNTVAARYEDLFLQLMKK